MTSEPSAKQARPSRSSDEPKATVVTSGYEKQDARLKQFDQVVAGCRELFIEKNTQYSDAISRTGVLGSVVSIAGLSARLEHLVLAAPDAGKMQEEAVVDVIKDLLNYAAITGIMIMDDNWRPE